MANRRLAPALYTLAGSLLLLVLCIAYDGKLAGALAGYAYGTLFDPISLIAALAIGALLSGRGWIALAAAVVVAVAIHFVLLSIDPEVAQLRRVDREPVSDTFVLIARVWGMAVAVSLVVLVATWVKRWLGAPAETGLATDEARRR